MQRFKGTIISQLAFWALMLTCSFAGAQPQPTPAYSVAITPAQAAIEPGGVLQLEAHLFDARGQKVESDGLEWSVKPDSLGEISDEGLFQAGRLAGSVRILAVFKRANVRYYGEAEIAIGQPRPPLIKIEVLPQNAAIEPGGNLQYHLTAIARDNSNLQIDTIRWTVEPRHIGSIDQDGLFEAASSPAQGQVIAYVHIQGAVYRGMARVTVSEKPTASVSGAVTDETTGQPIVGAQLLVQKIGPLRWVRSVRTDADGKYVANQLIPGLYIVRASAKTYLTEFYDDKDALAEANVLTINAEDSLTGVDFALLLGGAIRGFVKSGADSLPIANSLVAAVHVISQRKIYTKSGADGHYEIDGLPAGDFYVHAEAAGYRGEFFDDIQRGGHPDILTISPPNVLDNIDFHLAASSGIAGKVVDAASGEPVADAMISVLESGRGRKLVQMVARTKTNEKGEFLAGVRPGKYFVFAEAKGFVGEYVDNKLSVLDADTIEIMENAHTRVPDVALDRLGSIAGQVIDEDSKAPLAGATVIAFLEYDPRMLMLDLQSMGPVMRSYQARTDNSGNYFLEDLPTGKYFLKAFAKDYLPEYYGGSPTFENAALVEVAQSTAVTGIDFELGIGGKLSGTVVDSATGLPLAGATVSLWSDAIGNPRVAFTDRAGHYQVAGLPAGEYLVFARVSGYDGRFYDGVDYQAEATPVPITSGANVVGIDFSLPKFVNRSGTIAGVVLAEPDSNSAEPGRPIAGAKVLAIPVVPGPAHFDITDALGSYRITRLIPGDYFVLVWARGHIVEFFDDAHHWREADLVTVAANQAVDGIDFALQLAPRGPYRIRGKLHKHQSGSFVASAVSLEGLAVYAYNDAGIIGSALTDGNGTFRLDDLPSGEYKLKINGAGYEDAYYGGADDQSALTVTVSSGRSQDDIQIEIGETTTDVQNSTDVLPESFYLEQNYPNPFNPETTIRFALAADSEVKVMVYNLIGQQVRTLVDAKMNAGLHQVRWDGISDGGLRVASGIYLLRFEAGEVIQIRRMILMK
ncbi:MAG: carboxypeptidase regulatory-like domain-containing protein [Deferribacteres bacterium]|nr:carboxypeptidase regulatory-like domain-containing protein [Deferribacteres bacterium]